MRWLTIVIVVSLLVLFAAQPARADDPPGAKLFATYCAACHGAAGKGGFAPSIGAEAYLGAHDDAAITKATNEGIAGKGMPAWNKSKGGSLSDDQIANIVAYLRSMSSAAPVPTASAVLQPAPNPVYIQTKLKVTQVANPEGGVILNAWLADHDDFPVSDQAIAFSRTTTFGTIDLGTVKTGANGVASLTLRDVPPDANIVAAFQGEKNWNASTAKVVLDPMAVAVSPAEVNVNSVRLSVGDEPLLAPEGSLITPYPPLLPVTLFALVVGCVWAAYGFVVYQVVAIWRNGRSARRENTFTRKAR
ncbi:MAG: c-type cytochrome [Chloroflexota bacterium]|nr:c-type cytochrome [Chloroflexota bacterium]